MRGEAVLSAIEEFKIIVFFWTLMCLHSLLPEEPLGVFSRSLSYEKVY